MSAYSTSIVNLPYPSIYGLVHSKNLTSPTTKVDVSAGGCRDSTNTFDMVLNSSITIDTGKIGLNGIDSGSLAASSTYAVYLISDPINGFQTGGLISLASNP